MDKKANKYPDIKALDKNVNYLFSNTVDEEGRGGDPLTFYMALSFYKGAWSLDTVRKIKNKPIAVFCFMKRLPEEIYEWLEEFDYKYLREITVNQDSADLETERKEELDKHEQALECVDNPLSCETGVDIAQNKTDVIHEELATQDDINNKVEPVDPDESDNNSFDAL